MMIQRVKFGEGGGGQREDDKKDRSGPKKHMCSGNYNKLAAQSRFYFLFFHATQFATTAIAMMSDTGLLK